MCVGVYVCVTNEKTKICVGNFGISSKKIRSCRFSAQLVRSFDRDDEEDDVYLPHPQLIFHWIYENTR